MLEGKKKFVLAGHLLQSGTSTGANVREAQNAESKPGCIYKFNIAAKVVEETEYWLLICKKSNEYPNPGFLMGKLKSIQKIITKIIVSSKDNRHISICSIDNSCLQSLR